MATVTLLLRELLSERENRENRRIRLAEIARATGLSTNALQSMINNETDRVSLSALGRLCDYFRVTPAELLRLQPDAADEDTIDARDIVEHWDRQYGDDEHPRV